MKCPRHPKSTFGNGFHTMDFHSLSKSGKTIYWYYYCDNCESVYRKGFRVVEIEAEKRRLKKEARA